MKIKYQIFQLFQLLNGVHTLICFCIMIILLNSCEKKISKHIRINAWQGVVLKNNKIIYVNNVDSVVINKGDTVTVFFDEDSNNYYISDSKTEACDTSTTEFYYKGDDTIQFHFEAWNVRLEERVYK